jgi:glycosyltransferase involved in cell wall biosynthesis
MKLAFIAPRFPEAGVVGGAETLIRSLADYLGGQGNEVHFLTTCARDHHTWKNEIPPGEKTDGHLTVHFFPVNEDRDVSVFLRLQEQVSSGKDVSPSDQARWMRESVNSRALEAWLEAEGASFDAIIAGPYLYGITYHALRVHPDRSWLLPCLHDEAFAYQSVIGDLFHQVKGVLFNSEPEQALAERLYGLPHQKGAIVGMGLEPFKVDAKAFAARHGITQPYVLYAGRREPLKGTPLLLDYVNTFRLNTQRDIKLVLTGSGAIDIPRELEGHVIDVGFVSEQEKHEAMAGARVFIHPSVNESFGIVLLESWLAGTPALVHAKSEVLKFQCQRSGGGLWFRYYPEFEAMLLALLDRKDLHGQLASSGNAYVRTSFTWSSVAARFSAAVGT